MIVVLHCVNIVYLIFALCVVSHHYDESHWIIVNFSYAIELSL